MIEVCGLCGRELDGIATYTLYMPDKAEDVHACGVCYLITTIKDQLEELNKTIKEHIDEYNRRSRFKVHNGNES